MAMEIVAGFMLLILLIVIFALLMLAFWIWMIIDCAQRDFRKENDKIVWILVIVLLGGIGAAVYYFAVKRADKKQAGKKK